MIRKKEKECLLSVVRIPSSFRSHHMSDVNVDTASTNNPGLMENWVVYNAIICSYLFHNTFHRYLGWPMCGTRCEAGGGHPVLISAPAPSLALLSGKGAGGGCNGGRLILAFVRDPQGLRIPGAQPICNPRKQGKTFLDLQQHQKAVVVMGALKGAQLVCILYLRNCNTAKQRLNLSREGLIMFYID